MLQISNDLIALAMNEDGTDVRLKDLARDTEWKLDPSTVGYHEFKDMPDTYDFMWNGGTIQSPHIPLANGKAECTGNTIKVTFENITYTWQLKNNYVTVSLKAAGKSIAFISLPGSMRPVTEKASAALPVYQGVLAKPEGKKYETTQENGGHAQMSMSFAAPYTCKAALMIIQESTTDWVCTHGRDDQGMYAYFEQRRCPVDGWYEREIRLVPSDPDITAICKNYRQRIIERGEFKTWEQKIAEKPILEKLFGALIAFIGYNKTDEIDYVESTRKLKEYGFENLLIYSTRICNYSLDFKMGGDDPIWLSDEEVAGMQASGALLSPWGWCYEALDDGSDETRGILRKTPEGNFKKHWQIDDFVWYEVCPPYQIEHMKQRYATDFKDMEWIHYDVNAMRPGLVCFNEDHELHDNQPLDRRTSLNFIRELFSKSTVGNRIVSSEGFVDRYAAHYDIGSSKIYPAWGDADFIPVPMTMLVFHDSCVHDWWEVHNYNNHPGFNKDKDQIVGFNSCGRPEQKAALDALYGTPPNLFPFGKQYAWVNIETKETMSYKVTLDDEEVQRAIKAALPIAEHHKKVGKCELVSFEFVTEDCAVQKTIFSDGTTVVANISDAVAKTETYGTLKPFEWITSEQ